MTLSYRTLGDIVANQKMLLVEASSTVLDAVRLMTDESRGAVLVTRQGRLAGIFTERDLMTRVVARGMDPASTPLSGVMTQQVVVARPDETYSVGLNKMSAAHCRHLPVVDGDRVIGLVSRRELMALDTEVLESMLEKRDPSSLFF